MSSYWKFEVHIKTPGETDDEETVVRQFAALVQSVARIINRDDLDVTVMDTERT